MKRCLAALFAAIVVSGAALPAAADGPFETVPLPPPAAHPHRTAYVCLLAGAGLIGASFGWANRADDAYAQYLAATTPEDINHYYDEAAHYDRVSSASLLTGEFLIATGLYLRFLHRPAAPLGLAVGPSRCVVSYRF